MPYLLENLDPIEKLVRQAPFGLITDVDGTISQIAPTPQQAKISPPCRLYLSTLCRHLALVAAISGRPATEVKNMVGIDDMVYVGNHGLERLTGDNTEFTGEARDYRETIQAAIKVLQPRLSLEGVIIEDKGISASVHYRLSPEPETAIRAILETIDKLPGGQNLRIKQGRKIIDILPPSAANKGTAVQDLIERYRLHGGVYLGDDLTDIDAFRAIRAHPHFHGLAIGVTSPEMPENLVDEVDFTLNGVADVELLLKWLSQRVAE